MSRTRLAASAATALSTVLALVAGALVTLSAPVVATAAPRVTVARVASGLNIPWDITWVGNLMLFDQRAGSVWSKRGSAAPRRLRLPMPPIYARGEGGLLGLVADPRAATNKHFYTCMAVATASGGPRGVEVWKWRLASDTTAVKVKTLIAGIPLNRTGRHSGCRLRFRSATMLYVGTGDATNGTNPQNLQSLGGKILRIRSDGYIPRSNPFYARGRNARLVFNYGHRNIQGLIKRPGRSELWSVEHGPTRDDEINLVWSGRNYGWDPTPGYNESRSMTDKRRHPRANGAKWSSGSPTVATSGGAFISGAGWGTWHGRLAVAMLKGKGIRLFTVNRDNKITGQQTVFRSYGRIRTVQHGPDGALYFTTSNGSGDAIYRVTAG